MARGMCEPDLTVVSGVSMLTAKIFCCPKLAKEQQLETRQIHTMPLNILSIFLSSIEFIAK